MARLFNAPGRCFDVWEGRSLLKRLPIKGLQGAPLPLERFITWMRGQVLAEERRSKLQSRAFGWRQLLLLLGLGIISTMIPQAASAWKPLS